MVTNVEVAAQFDEIADRLLLQGDSWFKVSSYRRAAETLRAAQRPLAGLAAEHQLLKLPGVGQAIATKIGDFLRTGEIPLLERLRAEQPDGLLRLLRESSLQPRQIRALAGGPLKIDSPEALAAAAADGRLDVADGLDPDTVTAIRARLRDRM